MEYWCVARRVGGRQDLGVHQTQAFPVLRSQHRQKLSDLQGLPSALLDLVDVLIFLHEEHTLTGKKPPWIADQYRKFKAGDSYKNGMQPRHIEIHRILDHTQARPEPPFEFLHHTFGRKKTTSEAQTEKLILRCLIVIPAWVTLNSDLRVTLKIGG
eukprot:CAMPEP_0204296254 /NCGR_PEP_ID=MMETSP0468-20130131/71131_1 /ASSEMBLY_ACC=CAM_ASM_000383 /TAXON_ID=2969 /ORGANISM="Oxyrrhis marina" /LENGTH=155 /DNA_ID=CAMNT_0051274939 /DNA_START=196 /DNA_END=663 /DNA_ORIENTATION=+